MNGVWTLLSVISGCDVHATHSGGNVKCPVKLLIMGLQPLKGLNAPDPMPYVATSMVVMYTVSPHTLLQYNTSAILLLVYIHHEMTPFSPVQCFTNFHILDTLRHLQELGLCTNYSPIVGSL